MKDKSIWPAVLAEILRREKPVRHLTLVGVIRNAKLIDLARKCAWCGRWASQADYLAAHRYDARVSHGICDPCARKFEADYNAIVPAGPEGPKDDVA